MTVGSIGGGGGLQSLAGSVAPRGQAAIGRPQTPASGSIQNTAGNVDGARAVRGGIISATPSTSKATMGGLAQGSGLMSSSSGGLMSLGQKLDVMG